MTTSTPTTAEAMRYKLINGLYPPIRDLILAIDSMTASISRHDGYELAHVREVARLRDAYLEGMEGQ